MTNNAGKMEVVYSGNIWISNTCINSSTFNGYKESHPNEKIIISREGTSLNVILKYISIIKDEKRKIPMHD